MDSFEKLEEYFAKFPGIGRRQAKRFVFHIIGKNEAYVKDFCSTVLSLKKEISVCPECFRNFSKKKQPKCSICENTLREANLLLIVATDTDLETIEKSGSYHGYYFVLGGLIPILDKDPDSKIRLRDLEKIIIKRAKLGLKEIILALSANPEAENTSDYIKEKIAPLAHKYGITLSELGRGLSSGSEVEYSDKETIKNALERRK